MFWNLLIFICAFLSDEYHFASFGFCFLCKQISRYLSDPQYYFQVNDQYVRNKLKVVLFPFLHRVSDVFIGQSSLVTLARPFINLLCVFLSSGSLDTNNGTRGREALIQTPYLRYQRAGLVHPIHGFWHLWCSCWLIVGTPGPVCIAFSDDEVFILLFLRHPQFVFEDELFSGSLIIAFTQIMLAFQLAMY